jgi:signal transduction histidine kinase
MSLHRASTRIGVFALLVGVIVLSLFGSLAAADRALAAADSEAASLDARAAALITERELRIKATGLSESFGPLLPTASGTQTAPDTAGPATVFDATWILDRQGRVVWQLLSRSIGIGEGTLAALSRRIDATNWPLVQAVTSGQAAEGGVLVAVPLTHRGQPLGAAIGFLSGTRMLSTLEGGATARHAMALRGSGETIAVIGDRGEGGSEITRAALIRLPGDRLELVVVHRQTGRALRQLLWMLGAIALAALLAGLVRERRHSIGLADRTAELERLYQEVARSNRMKSEFLANVSHELRTPLNAIVGFVEMLREGVYGELSPRQALPVERIAGSATHLRHLVDRLLDIAKIAAGRLEVHTEPLVLRPFVLDVASEMESLVSERGLTLSIGVGPALPRIRTDQTHLRQILINLIGNAVKYTPSGGVQVRARLAGNGVVAAGDDSAPIVGPAPDPTRSWVALQVSDSGVGIAPTDLERIFDEFEQVNAGARTDSARRGTGLGLAISRRLARLLGGELTVVSAPGKGSTFTVWLPVDAETRSQDG